MPNREIIRFINILWWLGKPNSDKNINKVHAHELITVNKFCEESGIQPDFIKIDVEGSEWNILKGSDNIIHSCDSVMVEYRKTSKIQHKALPDPARVDGILINEYQYNEPIILDKFDKLFKRDVNK